MFELDRLLAQDIVDRAMAILPYNINVMDRQGVIIGSGDPQRVDSLHEGAQLVLANQRVVALDEQAAACLQGVKPGINLPLLHAGRLVGVLGITGDPEQVRPFAELLRMTAEMLVEQRVLQAEQHWRGQQQEAWLVNLLERGYPLASLEADAERLRMRWKWPLQGCLLCLASETDHELAQGQLISQMRLRHPHDIILPLGLHDVLWLRSGKAETVRRSWLEQADQRGWPVGRLLLAEAVESLADLREATEALINLRDYAQEMRLSERLVGLGDYRLAVLLHQQQGSWTVQRLLAPLQPLRRADGSGQLVATLRSWLQHNGHTQACAAALQVHRNTLRYRLDRIAEITGLDLDRMTDRMLLSIGLALFPE
ncbi:sugar diacid recognition domain-containing protein [Halopseudomonas pachastrellae]|jgi:carbohydrate diacid regulator|nr:sugar diacid recognition domain-containing protein [Pseudomonadota bacterium]WVM91745.1 sugar diacid recognition domain-containing protein [Halopseudomonas pachastrellae]